MANFGDKNQLKILIDTVKNPSLGYFLGGPSASQAQKILKKKYGYTTDKIKRLER
jgi:hypothetical protein